MNVEPGISWDIIGAVIHALSARGHDLMIERAAMVSSSRINSVLDTAAKALRDEAVSLSLVPYIPIGALGVLDYAFCSSANVRQALRRASRHFSLLSQRLELVVVERPPRASFEFKAKTGAVNGRWIELGIAMIATRMRQTSARSIAFQVELKHERQGPARPYTSFFGGDVRFGAAYDRAEFDSELLDQPLVTAANIELNLERVLGEQREQVDPLVDRVRREIMVLLDGRGARVEDVAKRLQTTTRTLQRELRTQGTSFTTVLDQVRRELALRYVEDPELTVGEIAARLGFAEESSLFRAFRRWTGRRPRGAKRQSRGTRR
jgi:AraC-like DNA-binding protein